MQNLDDIAGIQKLDPSNVAGSIELFPKQLLQAWEDAKKIVFPEEYKTVQNIVVCGMGGSRFTPKTIKELYWSDIPIPYELVDGYELPNYISEHTLVILSSYSGSTEEVIACGQEALKRKAKLTGLAAGGNVIELLRTNNCPFYQFNPIHNPCGQPRVGGGYLLMGHAAFLTTLGFLTLDEKEVQTAIDWGEKVGMTMTPSVCTVDNPAKKLALSLKDTHPFIIGAEFLRGMVNGFANQINETAKMISDFRYIPELNHHLMEGLTHPETLHQNGMFVFIHSKLYSERIQKRFTITNDVVTKQKVKTITIELTGTNKLSQIIEGFTIAGFTTFYMAMLYNTDPVSIPWVDYFKNQLSK